jgi:hypothetical protein
MTYNEFQRKITNAGADLAAATSFAIQSRNNDGYPAAYENFRDKAEKLKMELLATPTEQRGIRCIDNNSGAGTG